MLTSPLTGDCILQKQHSIQNIAASMGSGKAVALVLLDLSVTFDTFDHNILFDCLRDCFGVDGTVLRRVKSYLTNHKQKVKLKNSFSDAFSLLYGVPQGSVLGPLLFSLYTSPPQQHYFQFQCHPPSVH